MMEPTEKRQQSCSEPGNKMVEDRISELPDSILCHILSKLTTKQAASTVFFSTRWENLFSQVLNLEIDIEDPHIKTKKDKTYANFTRFMYNLLTVILADVPCIRRCFIDLKQSYPDDDINAWMSALIRLNVQEVYIFFQDNHIGISSDALFRSKSLSIIMLSHHNFNQVSESISLPNLKTLIMFNVTFLNGDLVERVISVCPVLNDLSLSNIRIKEVVDVLRISSRSVKEATFTMMSECCGDKVYDIVLDMPSLEMFHYDDHLAKSYCVKSLKGVRKAHIDVGPSKKQCKEEREEMWRRVQSVRDLVEACSDARSLFLSYITIAVLSCSSHLLPTFNNLTKLEVGCVGEIGWELLPELLESAPNLESLVFKRGFLQLKGCYAKFRSNIPEFAPRCLTLHLHSITFEAFNGEEDEVDLVEYFLNHAQFLRNIKFRFSCSLSPDKISCTKSKLWTLRNQSGKSEVDFVFEVETDWKAVLLRCQKKREELRQAEQYI